MKLFTAYLFAVLLVFTTTLAVIFSTAAADPKTMGSQTRYALKGDADLFAFRSATDASLRGLESMVRSALKQVYNTATQYPNFLEGETTDQILANTTSFLRQLQGVSSAFSSKSVLSMRYAYAIKYQCHDDDHNGGGNNNNGATSHCHWTEAGATFDSGATYTYFTDADGMFRDYRGQPNAYTSYDVINQGGWVENEYYATQLAGLTAANQNGQFLNAYYYFSPTLNKNLALITVGMPITFDKDGRATAVAAIDLSLDAWTPLLGTLSGTTGANAEGMILDARNPSSWKFISGTQQPAFNGTGMSNQNYPYPATETPNWRVNEYTKTLRTKLGGNVLSKLDPGMNIQPTSFDGADGFTYSACSFFGTFLFVSRVPQSLMGATSTGVILSTMFVNVVAWTKSIAAFSVLARNGLLPNGNPASMGDVFDTQASMQNIKPLFDALGGMVLGARGLIRYAYFSYKLNDNSGRWGDLWSEFQMDAKNKAAFYQSSFVATNGTRYDWPGQGPYSNYPFSMVTPDATVENETYIQFVQSLTQANQSGVFQPPQSWTDPVTKITTKIVTFTVPLTFDTNGNCNLAFSLDIDIDWLRNAVKLHIETHESTSNDNLISMIWAAGDLFVFDTNNDNAAWKSSFPNAFNIPENQQLAKNYYNINQMCGGMSDAKQVSLSFPCTQSDCPAKFGSNSRSVNNIVNVQVITGSAGPVFYIIEQVPLDVITTDPANVESQFPGVPMMLQTARRSRAQLVNAQFQGSTLNNMINGFYAGLNTPCSNGDTVSNAFLNAILTPVAKASLLPVNSIRVTSVGTVPSSSMGVCGIVKKRSTGTYSTFYSSVDGSQFYLDGVLSSSKGSIFTTNLAQFNDLQNNDATLLVYSNGDRWYATPYVFTNPDGTNLQIATVVQGAMLDLLWNVANPQNIPSYNRLMGVMYSVDYALTSFDGTKSTSTLMDSLFPGGQAGPLGMGDAFITDVLMNSYVAGVNVKTFFDPNTPSTYVPPYVNNTPVARINTVGTIVTNELKQTAANFLAGNSQTLETAFYLNDGFNYYIVQCWFWTIVLRSPAISTPAIANVKLSQEQARANLINTGATNVLKNLIGGVKYWDMTDPNALVLMRSLEAILLSFQGKVVYSYFSYQLPGKTDPQNGNPLWGDFGCELLAKANAAGGLVNCMLVSDNETRYDWYGSDIVTKTPFSAMDFQSTTYYDYTVAIGSTSARYASNFWTAPYSYTDPVSQQTDVLATLTNGIAFSPTSGNITTSISVDINLIAMNDDLESVRSTPDEQIILMFHDNMAVSPQYIAAVDAKTAAKVGSGNWATDVRNNQNGFIFDIFTWAVNNMATGVVGTFFGWRSPISVFDTTKGLLSVLPFASVQRDSQNPSQVFYNWATLSNVPASSSSLAGGNELGVNPNASKKGLPAGAIAGIVIAVAAGVAVAVFFAMRKKSGGSDPAPNNQHQYVAYQNAEIQGNSQV